MKIQVTQGAVIRTIIRSITCEWCCGSGFTVFCQTCRCKTCGGVGWSTDGGTRDDQCTECFGEAVEDCPDCGYGATLPAERDAPDAHVCVGCDGWGIVRGAGEEGVHCWRGVLDGVEPFSVPDTMGAGRLVFEAPRTPEYLLNRSEVPE